jgi:hypothetical protein
MPDNERCFILVMFWCKEISILNNLRQPALGGIPEELKIYVHELFSHLNKDSTKILNICTREILLHLNKCHLS